LAIKGVTGAVNAISDPYDLQSIAQAAGKAP